MSIEIEIDGIDADRWNELVTSSPHGTPFHRHEALDLMDQFSNASVHLLVGYKGEEPAGLFPIFERSVGPLTTILSPPPDLKVPYLGPILLNTEKLKRRKLDRRHRRFIDACLRMIDERFGPDYQYLRTNFRYDDPRPLLWNGFTATPKHTYLVDLTRDEQDLFMAFSADVRKNVREGEEVDYDIYQGGPDDIEWVIDQVAQRHRQQGLPYRVPSEFAIGLHEHLPEGALKTYVCTMDGSRISGHLVMSMDSILYSWQSIGRMDAQIAGTDLVHWEIIRDGIASDHRYYDLVGANNARLSGYKAKFAPVLRCYYRMEQGPWYMRTLASMYNRLQ